MTVHELKYKFVNNKKHANKEKYVRDDTVRVIKREILVDSAPIYDGITIYVEATIMNRKWKQSFKNESGWIETILLTKVKFDGITIDHIWVKTNPNLDNLELNERISFKCRGYSYVRRNGSISLGLRKICEVRLIKPLKYAGEFIPPIPGHYKNNQHNISMDICEGINPYDKVERLNNIPEYSSYMVRPIGNSNKISMNLPKRSRNLNNMSRPSGYSDNILRYEDDSNNISESSSNIINSKVRRHNSIFGPISRRPKIYRPKDIELYSNIWSNICSNKWSDNFLSIWSNYSFDISSNKRAKNSLSSQQFFQTVC